MLSSIERATKQKVEPLTLPSVEELTNTRVEKFTKRIDDVLAQTELSELTDVIEQYSLSAMCRLEHRRRSGLPRPRVEHAQGRTDAGTGASSEP